MREADTFHVIFRTSCARTTKNTVRFYINLSRMHVIVSIITAENA
jgi:hypothetical protein